MYLTRGIRGWDRIKLSYPIFSIRWDWILRLIIYPTKTFDPTKRDMIVIFYLDIIK